MERNRLEAKRTVRPGLEQGVWPGMSTGLRGAGFNSKPVRTWLLNCFRKEKVYITKQNYE